MISAPGTTGALANPKFLDALFGNEAVRNKRVYVSTDNSLLQAGMRAGLPLARSDAGGRREAEVARALPPGVEQGHELTRRTRQEVALQGQQLVAHEGAHAFDQLGECHQRKSTRACHAPARVRSAG